MSTLKYQLERRVGLCNLPTDRQRNPLLKNTGPSSADNAFGYHGAAAPKALPLPLPPPLPLLPFRSFFIFIFYDLKRKLTFFIRAQTADNSGANHNLSSSQSLSPFPSLFNSPHLNLRSQSYYQDAEDEDANDNNIDFDIPLSLSSVESIQPFSRLSNYLNTESDDEEQIELDTNNHFQPQRRDQLFLSSLSENSLTLACNLGLPFPILPSQPKNVR